MAHDLVCWKCGTSLAELTLPLRRLDECPQCRAELHVCRMCVDYDTRVAKHCREPTAEEVSDKTHANFCDHFKPRPGAYTPPDTVAARQGARRAREALRQALARHERVMFHEAQRTLGQFLRPLTLALRSRASSTW